ncbi:MAG: hypothetical protein HY906_14910 [Deltaproteobacteria bacterium]|nr:hypothetical protein [Deltaproteobacteria bacterium]
MVAALQAHQPPVDLQHQQPGAAYESDADIGGPDDPGRARRLTWSELFRRVWREDVLHCSKCGGELRLIAVVQDATVCEKILRHLGLWQRGPPAGRRVVVESADHEPPYVD